MRNSRRSRHDGFTIIELMIVLVVISIIAAIAVVSLLSAFDKAKQRATMADMRTISKAIEAYIVDLNTPPNYNGPVSGLVSDLTPYHSSIVPIRDHWNHDILYAADGLSNYTVESLGKDGVDGADITLSSRLDFDLDIVLVNGAFVASPE